MVHTPEPDVFVHKNNKLDGRRSEKKKIALKRDGNELIKRSERMNHHPATAF